MTSVISQSLCITHFFLHDAGGKDRVGVRFEYQIPIAVGVVAPAVGLKITTRVGWLSRSVSRNDS
jgi:hypothetical protein